MRGTGPVGYPGARRGGEHAAARATCIKKGVTALPCIGDGRQSGTSGSPSILNASPEAATGGGLAILKTGDRVRIDLNKRTADILISKEEYDKPPRRRCRATAATSIPATRRRGRRSSAAWSTSSPNGMVLKPAVKYQRIAKTKGIPRDNH